MTIPNQIYLCSADAEFAFRLTSPDEATLQGTASRLGVPFACHRAKPGSHYLLTLELAERALDFGAVLVTDAEFDAMMPEPVPRVGWVARVRGWARGLLGGRAHG